MIILSLVLLEVLLIWQSITYLGISIRYCMEIKENLRKSMKNLGILGFVLVRVVFSCHFYVLSSDMSFYHAIF